MMTHAEMADRIDTLTTAIATQRALGDYVGADKLNVELQSIKVWIATADYDRHDHAPELGECADQFGVHAEHAAPPAMMTKTEAVKFRKDRVQRYRDLNRQTKPQLARMAQSFLLYGDLSKGELVTALVNARYPLALENEAIHVLHHADAAQWSACEHCARTIDAAMTAAEDAR